MRIFNTNEPMNELFVGRDYDLKDGSRKSYEKIAAMSDEELTWVGLARLVTPDIPKHKRVQNEEIKLIDGVPTTVYTYEDYPLDEYRSQKLQELAALRWERENAGALVGLMRIASDDRSKVMLSAVRAKAKETPAYTTKWKVSPGVFVALSAPMLIAIADAVEQHVSDCFDNEETLSKLLIAAQTYEAIDAVDLTRGWPQ